MQTVTIYNMVRRIVYSFMLSGVILLLCACGGKETISTVSKSTYDSTALRIAVFPTLDALPLALANDWGVYDSLGIKVELAVFRSQMEAEKSLADGRADAVLTDMFRVGWWQWKGKPIRFAFVTRRPLYVVPNKVLRISRVDQLDDRMIASTRYSMEDYFTRKVVATIKKRKGQILYPQINSLELRLSMLMAGQLDAVVLGLQQTLKARAAGYATLKTEEQMPDGLAGVAFNTNSLKKKRGMLNKLRNAYDVAVARLRKMPALQIDDQTRKALFLSGEIDSLINVGSDIGVTKVPDVSLKPMVAEWLRTNAATAGYTADTLFLASSVGRTDSHSNK